MQKYTWWRLLKGTWRTLAGGTRRQSKDLRWVRPWLEELETRLVPNGSFQSQSYSILQPNASVVSINHTAPADHTTNASGVNSTIAAPLFTRGAQGDIAGRTLHMDQPISDMFTITSQASDPVLSGSPDTLTLNPGTVSVTIPPGPPAIVNFQMGSVVSIDSPLNNVTFPFSFSENITINGDTQPIQFNGTILIQLRGDTLNIAGGSTTSFLGGTVLFSPQPLTFSYFLGSFPLTLQAQVQFTPLSTPPMVAADSAAVAVEKGQPASNTGTFADAQGNDTVTLSASLGTVIQNDAAGTWSWSAPTNTLALGGRPSRLPRRTASGCRRIPVSP